MYKVSIYYIYIKINKLHLYQVSMNNIQKLYVLMNSIEKWELSTWPLVGQKKLYHVNFKCKIIYLGKK